MKDSIKFSCVLSNDILSRKEIGLQCDVKNDVGMEMGSFNVMYKKVNGKDNIDFDVSKNLVGNLLMDGFKLNELIGKIGDMIF